MHKLSQSWPNANTHLGWGLDMLLLTVLEKLGLSFCIYWKQKQLPLTQFWLLLIQCMFPPEHKFPQTLSRVCSGQVGGPLTLSKCVPSSFSLHCGLASLIQPNKHWLVHIINALNDNDSVHCINVSTAISYKQQPSFSCIFCVLLAMFWWNNNCMILCRVNRHISLSDREMR